MFDSLEQLIGGYPWYEVIAEVGIIWVCVYFVFRFLRGTRGAGVIKGFAVLLVIVTLVIRLLAGSDAFGRLNFIYERFLALLAIVLIVVFQPELRQAMVRLGHARWLPGVRRRTSAVLGAVAEAVEFLSKSQFGALIAIEREVKLGGLVEGGETIDARVSARLLESIFWPNSPLHDLGVVIRNDRIIAANVQFPLVEEGALQRELGSRHRAALGLTMETDCVVVIVSEETGSISIAEHGSLHYDIARDQLVPELVRHLATPDEQAEAAQAQAGTEPTTVTTTTTTATTTATATAQANAVPSPAAAIPEAQS